MPLLKEFSFFKDRHMMSKRDLSEISNHLKYEFLEAGDTIFKQGDPGDQFYIIMKGQVQVSIAEKK